MVQPGSPPIGRYRRFVHCRRRQLGGFATNPRSNRLVRFNAPFANSVRRGLNGVFGPERLNLLREVGGVRLNEIGREAV